MCVLHCTHVILLRNMCVVCIFSNCMKDYHTQTIAFLEHTYNYVTISHVSLQVHTRAVPYKRMSCVLTNTQTCSWFHHYVYYFVSSQSTLYVHMLYCYNNCLLYVHQSDWTCIKTPLTFLTDKAHLTRCLTYRAGTTYISTHVHTYSNSFVIYCMYTELNLDPQRV